MASPTRWTWVWVNSSRWWWTGRPGVLRFMGSQRVGHDWETELNWTELNGLVVFLYFLQFKSEFGNKEFMIWTSQLLVLFLYRASPSLAAKNIIILFQYWPSDDVHVLSLLLCCWKRVFAMTSMFSWQISKSTQTLHDDISSSWLAENLLQSKHLIALSFHFTAILHIDLTPLPLWSSFSELSEMLAPWIQSSFCPK